MRKLNQAGALDPLLIILIVVVVLLGCYAGWTVFGQSNEESSVVKPTQESAVEDSQVGLTEFVSVEYGFKFSYPSDWGEVSVEDSNAVAKNGKAYSVVFSNSPKLLAGFYTKDWEPKDDVDSLIPGFKVYGYCTIGPKYNNVIELYSTADACVVVAGSPKDDFSGRPSANIFLEKAFNKDSKYAGVSFMHAPVGGIADTSSESLQNAYPADITNGFIEIAKSIQEL